MSVFLLLSYTILVLFVLWVLKENIAEIRKNSSNQLEVVKFLLWSPLLFVFLSVLLILTPLGKIYQYIAFRILKNKLCGKFCKVVNGTNTFMGSDDWENSLVNVFVIFRYDKTIAKKDFFQYTKELVENLRFLDRKYFSSLYEFMGYVFFKGYDYKMSDFIRQLPVTNKDLDKAELLNVVKSCVYQPLPFDGTALWDIYIGTQPIKNWRPNSESRFEYYPVLIRTHHVLADGLSLAKTLFAVFGNIENIEVRPETRNNTNSKRSVFSKVIKNVCIIFRMCVMFLSSAYIFMIMKGHDTNDLHGKPYDYQQLLDFNVDEEGIYFEKVKKIKRIFSDTTFPEIILTAYGASLYDYFQKHSPDCPESITTSLPIITDINQIRKLIAGQITPNDITTTNEFVFVKIMLPIDITKNKDFNKNSPLISRLKIIRKLTSILKDSTESQFSYILVSQILGSLPFCVSRTFAKSLHCTTVGTFLPGTPRVIHQAGVYEMADVMFWVPHIVQLGIGISVLTFDSHLAAGFNCNGQIKEQSGLEEIAHNTYRYIDLMEEEVERLYVNGAQ